MNREEIYDKVNKCETLDELADVILECADENGDIQGRTRSFSARKMAIFCRGFSLELANTLTREFGIRQQAMYIVHYIKEELDTADKIFVRLSTSDIVLTKEDASRVSNYIKILSQGGDHLTEVEVYSIGYEDEEGRECTEDGTYL